MPNKDEIKKNFSDWVASTIMSDQFVSSFSNDILEKPKYTITEGDNVTNYYSREQMIDMFRAGFLSMTRDSFEKEVFKNNQHASISMAKAMKMMNIGDKITFPYRKWNAVRSTASELKKQFGVRYLVRKVSSFKTIGDIEVTRTA